MGNYSMPSVMARKRETQPMPIRYHVLLVFLTGIVLTLPCPAQDAGPASSKDTLAIVAGQPLSEGDLLPLIQAPLRQLRNQEYELKRKTIDALIEQRLLEAAAKKKGLSVEQLLEKEVNAKVKEPTEGEVDSYYLGLKDRLNRPFAEVKDQLQDSLKTARLQQARDAYAKRLREKAEVVVLLTPPKTKVDHDPARLRGSPEAPITIVEFSDYQCQFCGRVEATLKNILKKYEGKARLAYRDFPLTQIHSQAQSAAEASRCAADQGKFWEYHDLLFANQNKLDSASLTGYAGQLKLDEKTFEKCVKDGRHKAAVEQDMQEGAKLGLSGTPAFFINGVFLNGAQPAAVFEQTIESELAAVQR